MRSFLKKKFTNTRMQAHGCLKMYKSIINRIIKEIHIHKSNLPNFFCIMHFSYEITKRTKGK